MAIPKKTINSGPEDCPKCKKAIPVEANECPRCQFSVAGHKENLRNAKCVLMTREIPTQARISAVLGPIFSGADATSLEEEDDRNRRASLALRPLHNTYRDVTCPNCGHQAGTQTWVGKDQWYDCPNCSKRSFRQKHLLCYIPRPDALLSVDIGVFADPEDRFNGR